MFSVAVLFPLSIPDFEDGLFSELLILNLFLYGDKSWAWVGIGGFGNITVLRLTAEVLGYDGPIRNEHSFFRGTGGDSLLKLVLWIGPL